MSGTICRNCGAGEGIHDAYTNRCPVGGVEAPIGKKQEWADTCWDPYDPDDDRRIAAMRHHCAGFDTETLEKGPTMSELVQDWKPDEASTGVELIVAERKRQVEEEGWTPEHDDQHIDGELARAGATYAMPPMKGKWIGDYRVYFFPTTWNSSWWKPSPDNRIRELVKAGALIAAEIDRLQRAAARGEGE